MLPRMWQKPLTNLPEGSPNLDLTGSQYQALFEEHDSSYAIFPGFVNQTSSDTTIFDTREEAVSFDEPWSGSDLHVAVHHTFVWNTHNQIHTTESVRVSPAEGVYGQATFRSSRTPETHHLPCIETDHRAHPFAPLGSSFSRIPETHHLPCTSRELQYYYPFAPHGSNAGK